MRITIPRAYFIVGFIFGLMFPVLAILLEIRLNDFPFSMAGVIAAHRSNQLLFIIDTAPIFLGLFAWFGGSRTETIKQIEQLSYCDQLTGLYNRRFLVMAYERLNIIRNMPFTVLALDVNGLKLVNDALGHHAGDELLIKVAKAIKENLRSDDIVARMGGDEFVVLLPNTNENIALQLVNRIRDDVKSIDVYGITGSISIGQCTANQITKLDDMLRFADEKMYTIKNCEGQHFRNNTVLSMYEKLLRLNDCEEIHGNYVYETAMKIGEKLNLSEVALINLGKSAKYHDIGKLAISEKILLKDAALSSEEYEKVKRHCEIGYQIIKSSDQLRHIAKSVLCHHENWDGTGYPNGLTGESIPLFSRIIRVADAFESMIHYRPYKAPMTIGEAITELYEHSGKQFDPEIVKAQVEIVSEVYGDTEFEQQSRRT